jgi:hypothetical protein
MPIYFSLIAILVNFCLSAYYLNGELSFDTVLNQPTVFPSTLNQNPRFFLYACLTLTSLIHTILMTFHPTQKIFSPFIRKSISFTLLLPAGYLGLSHLLTYIVNTLIFSQGVLAS